MSSCSHAAQARTSGEHISSSARRASPRCRDSHHRRGPGSPVAGCPIASRNRGAPDVAARRPRVAVKDGRQVVIRPQPHFPVLVHLGEAATPAPLVQGHLALAQPELVQDPRDRGGGCGGAQAATATVLPVTNPNAPRKASCVVASSKCRALCPRVPNGCPRKLCSAPPVPRGSGTAPCARRHSFRC